MNADNKKLGQFVALGHKALGIDVEDVRSLIELARHVFRISSIETGVAPSVVTALLTKFTDAGRRSPPTAAFSKLVPGRPQSGADGNREKRWRLEVGHKFYAEEIPATLVEVKYILETLSMTGAPVFPPQTIQSAFTWLTGQPVEPGTFRDPIQLIPISFHDFCADRRLIQSGHIYPLDRGGRHEPANAFLMLARSNQLQGNNTLPEMIDLMRHIVQRHNAAPDYVATITPAAETIAGEQVTNP